MAADLVKPRTDELIARIRAEIEARREDERGPVPPPPLRARAALASLARRLPLDPREEIRSHRPIVGPLVVLAKRCLRPLLFGLLEPWFRRENEFLRELVRYEAEVAARLEELANAAARDTARRESEEE